MASRLEGWTIGGWVAKWRWQLSSMDISVRWERSQLVARFAMEHHCLLHRDQSHWIGRSSDKQGHGGEAGGTCLVYSRWESPRTLSTRSMFPFVLGPDKQPSNSMPLAISLIRYHKK